MCVGIFKRYSSSWPTTWCCWCFSLHGLVPIWFQISRSSTPQGCENFHLCCWLKIQAVQNFSDGEHEKLVLFFFNLHSPSQKSWKRKNPPCGSKNQKQGLPYKLRKKRVSYNTVYNHACSVVYAGFWLRLREKERFRLLQGTNLIPAIQCLCHYLSFYQYLFTTSLTSALILLRIFLNLFLTFLLPGGNSTYKFAPVPSIPLSHSEGISWDAPFYYGEDLRFPNHPALNLNSALSWNMFWLLQKCCLLVTNEPSGAVSH